MKIPYKYIVLMVNLALLTEFSMTSRATEAAPVFYESQLRSSHSHNLWLFEHLLQALVKTSDKALIQNLPLTKETVQSLSDIQQGILSGKNIHLSSLQDLAYAYSYSNTWIVWHFLNPWNYLQYKAYQGYKWGAEYINSWGLYSSILSKPVPYLGYSGQNTALAGLGTVVLSGEGVYLLKNLCSCGIKSGMYKSVCANANLLLFTVGLPIALGAELVNNFAVIAGASIAASALVPKVLFDTYYSGSSALAYYTSRALGRDGDDYLHSWTDRLYSYSYYKGSDYYSEKLNMSVYDLIFYEFVLHGSFRNQLLRGAVPDDIGLALSKVHHGNGLSEKIMTVKTNQCTSMFGGEYDKCQKDNLLKVIRVVKSSVPESSNGSFDCKRITFFRELQINSDTTPLYLLSVCYQGSSAYIRLPAMSTLRTEKSIAASFINFLINITGTSNLYMQVMEQVRE